MSNKSVAFPEEAFRRYYDWAGLRDISDSKAIDEATPRGLDGADLSGDQFRNLMNAFWEHMPLRGEGFEVSDDSMWKSFGHAESAHDAGTSDSSDTVYVGLTGGRGVGKSYLTDLLVKDGFVRVHPFNPGKAFLRGYYVARGATEDEALSMTDGELKDKPAPRSVLPLNPETGKNYTSRFVMENLGYHMAKRVGLDSTIGTELRHWSAAGARKVLIDSVVYEADVIRSFPNSAVLGITVPEENRRNQDIDAKITDANVSKIRLDGVIVNRMEGPEAIMREFSSVCSGLVRIPEDQQGPEFS